ncbi:MAG: class I SAM-dependent methyltransferase [Victivallaceae bacterium]|nr:class I SAM-dependent methyltransferase [Victivallaceae bacterium]
MKQKNFLHIMQRNMESHGDTTNNVDTYKFQHETFQKSIAISLAIDYQFLRNSGDWIETNKNRFGTSVLDVGCSNGVLSCFLAMLLPQSTILAIDRCPEAIENATKLAQKLNLNNISFKVADISELNASFDTVFVSCPLPV